jgi:hypothetical protein
MQSLEASKNYKNSFVCAARIFKDEGLLTFWSGAVPRLARLIMSGGIVFTMFVGLSHSRPHFRVLIHQSQPGMRRQWRLSTLSILRGNTYDAGTLYEVVDALVVYMSKRSQRVQGWQTEVNFVSPHRWPIPNS